MNKDDETEKISGLIFVSLMFIGTGLGLLVGRPDVGGAMGMGFGFLSMAFLRYRGVKMRPEKTVSLRGSIGFIILASIGIMFIFSGVVLLFNLEYLMKYIGGIIAIAIGLAFLSAAFKLIVK